MPKPLQPEKLFQVLAHHRVDYEIKATQESMFEKNLPEFLKNLDIEKAKKAAGLGQEKKP